MAALAIMDLVLAQNARSASAHCLGTSAIAALPQSMKKHTYNA
jgi:hypothetical protein